MMTAEDSHPGDDAESPCGALGYDPLPVSRPLPPSRQVQRYELALDDGYRVSVYVHPAATNAPRRLPVVYAHGIQSHPGWFSGSAAHLSAAGHDVYQFTRRGSGDCPAGRGHAHSLEQLMQDVARWCRFARQRSRAERLHLLGVSWGGKLLACYAARGADDRLASLAMVAPGLAARVDVGLWTKLSIAAAMLVNPNERFDIPLSAPALFTDNPDMLTYLAGDPYRLHRATARFLYVSRQMDRRLARCRRGCLRLPTLLLLADRDRIVDNARTSRLVDSLTAGRASRVTLEGCHTLEFEHDPVPLYQGISQALARAES